MYQMARSWAIKQNNNSWLMQNKLYQSALQLARNHKIIETEVHTIEIVSVVVREGISNENHIMDRNY